MRNYHEESFSFEALPISGQSPQASRDADDTSAEPALETDADSSSVSPDEAVTTYTVEIFESGRTVACRTDESVLDGTGGRAPTAVFLQPGHVRHVQDDHVVRRGRHAAQRRNPPQGGCAEQDPDLLLQALERSTHRRVMHVCLPCPDYEEFSDVVTH